MKAANGWCATVTCPNAIMTGIGPVAVRAPRVRDRTGLARDREALLAFYDFPAEHWKHLRTTNPIESTFATVRHRTVRAKGCLSNTLTSMAWLLSLDDQWTQ